MVNYEGEVMAQEGLYWDDEGPEEDCNFRLMPFKSVDVEKDFLETFSKEQALWDVIHVQYVNQWYIRATALAPGVASLPNLAALYASVGLAIVIALLALFCHKAYIKWRTLIIVAYRALLAHNVAIIFYVSSTKRELTLPWIAAMVKVTVFMSRVMIPVIHFTTFQVPFNEWFLMTQCTMLAYFLQFNELECRDLAILPSLKRGVEEFFGFWKEVGTDGGANLCSSWCLEHMRQLSLCYTACPAVIQIFWRVVGRPSIQMCVSYRVVVEILFGFAMPLGYVYIHQVSARRRYAKRRHLRQADVPFFHARSSKLLFLDVALILGSVVCQLVEQPLQLLG